MTKIKKTKVENLKYLVIPDIHNRVDKADAIVNAVSHDKVIYLGDYFDAFNDNAGDTFITARWLKKSLQNPNRIHCQGNHDNAYRYSHDMEYADCPGWTKEKQAAVNSVLTTDDWDKIKYYHRIGNWIFSHAGLHKRYFEHPIKGFSLDYVEEVCKEAKSYAYMGLTHPIFRYGSRMGDEYPGGIFWLDWTDLEVIEGVNQVVGHTPDEYDQVRTLHYKNSQNYCIDTHLNHYGVFQNGKFSVFDSLNHKQIL